MAPQPAPAPPAELNLDEELSYQGGAAPLHLSEVPVVASDPAAIAAAVAWAEAEEEATELQKEAEQPPASGMDQKPEEAPNPTEDAAGAAAAAASKEEQEEEEPMRLATDEEYKQAEVVTAFLNETIGGGLAEFPPEEPHQPVEPEGNQEQACVEDKEVEEASAGEEQQAAGAPEAEAQAALQEELAAERKALKFAKAKLKAMRAKLKDVEAAAEEERKSLEAEMKTQQEYSEMTAAKALAAERTRSLQVLDGLRTEINVMGEAMSRKQEEVEGSGRTHRLSLAVFALQQALENGKGFGAELADVKASAPQDELVAAAANSLAAAALESGAIPSRLELIGRFDKVACTAGNLALVPEGHGSMLVAALSTIAAKLRLSEPEATRVGLGGGGIAAATSRARADLAAGRLQSAAQELEVAAAGTAAAPVVADWAQGARARAVADQALAMMQAHAMTVAASLGC